MTPQQKFLVQSSFSKVIPIADDAAVLFYNRLFDLDPKLKALFKSDMKEQGRKLMAMIRTAVSMLDRLGELVPIVEDLGKRHVAYGVKDEDYDTVGEALLWTLEQGLQEEFTTDVEEAWIAVYSVLSGAMKAAAAQDSALAMQYKSH